MNESWRRAEADAHEAKAEALGVAMDSLVGVLGAVDALIGAEIDLLFGRLRREKERHEKAAALARATVTA